MSKLLEDLRKWFNPSHPEGGWKRINSKGEAIGPCAREPGEPKPKCMSNAKRAALTKKERAAAVRAKRKHDPDPERKGEPINVSNFGKGKLSEQMKNLNEKNEPTSPEKWARAKAMAKQKFDVYPSAYANGWAAKKYKEMGGGWKTVSEAKDNQDDVGEMVKDKLKIIIERSQEIHDGINDQKELPEWIKSKITLAQDYISTVADYMHTSEVNEEVEQLDELGNTSKGQKRLDKILDRATNRMLARKGEEKAKAEKTATRAWTRLQKESYVNDDYKRNFKRRELEHELRHEVEPSQRKYPAAPKIYHKVSFAQKEDAKKEGMRFDGDKKKWYHTNVHASRSSNFQREQSEVFKSIRFAKNTRVGKDRIDVKHAGPSTDDEEHYTIGSVEFAQQLKHAKKRAMQESEQIDEISKDLARSYYGKAQSQVRATLPNENAKKREERRKKGIESAKTRIHTKEEIQVSESKKAQIVKDIVKKNKSNKFEPNPEITDRSSPEI